MTTPPDLVLRNGRIVTPAGIVEKDLAVLGERIASIGEATRGSQEIDATGKLILPGGIDVHAHIKQMSGMGQWNADTFETATRSAAMGGTTSVISFAAQAEGERLADTVARYAARARRGAMIDHAFHITITDPGVERFEDDLAQLIRAGHRSLKIFTTYNIRLGDAEILRVLSAAKASGALVCVHAENDAIIARERAALIAAGQTGARDHARSRPRVAEIEAVERLCHFAEHLRQPVMLFHISTAEAAQSIRAARARGAPVWAETCPHYLLMTEEVLEVPLPEGAKWMCSPPQRTEADQIGLWAALKDGTLDLVSSDHAPYRLDATGKLSAGPDAGFHQIANGLPGLETRLPLMFDAMAGNGMGVESFSRLTATRPAQVYGLQRKGALVPGMDADIVIWDPQKTVTYGANDLYDNTGYNPWEGRTVTGWPETVILRGRPIVDNGAFLGRPGAGLWIDRPAIAAELEG
jgi:dihydropyrimidinase